MRRTLVLVLVAVLAGCGGGSSQSTQAQAGQPKSETSAPASSAAVSDPESVEPEVPEPEVAEPVAVSDVDLIVAYARERNEAVRASPEGYFDELVEHAWPPGAWTADYGRCAIATTASMSVEQLAATFETPAGRDSQQLFVDSATAAASPDWEVPDFGQPGGGQVPDGNIWVVTVENPTGEKSDSHFTVIDGKVYYFPATSNVTGC